MNLLVLLLKLLMTKESLNAASKKTGISKEMIRKLLPLAIPLLIKYMTRNASSKNGAASLLSALGQHTSNRSLAEQISDVDEKDGGKIISHILGDDKDEVTERLAKQSGLSKAAVLAILAAIAPAILSTLSASNQQQVQQQPAANSTADLSSLMSLFGGQAAQPVQQQAQQPTSGLGLLNSLLGNQQVQQPVQQPVQQQSSGLGLLNSLLGSQQAQQPVQQQASGLGLLGSLMGALMGVNALQQQAQQPQPQLTESSIDGTDLLALLSQLAK